MLLENARILAPVGYPWDFCGPHSSRATIARRKFVPFNRFHDGWDGFTLFNPLDVMRCNLIHAFNRIPLHDSAYVIGFESHLPRLFAADAHLYERRLYNRLLSRKCKKIVAISKFASDNFVASVLSAPILEADRNQLLGKLDVRYPSIPIGAPPLHFDRRRDEWVITFVGGHFGRKGGCVAVRLAQLAHKLGLPLTVNIVSSLQSGGAIWTDPSDSDFFLPYYRLLSLPNVRHHLKLANADVLKLLGESDFSLLTTFSDTFGFSVIESMARGTPPICTAQGALPEFVIDGRNGIVVSPAMTPGQRHWGPSRKDRETENFARLYRDEIERMANACIERLITVMGTDGGYNSMRLSAYATANALFGEKAASSYWDQTYAEALSGETRSMSLGWA